MKNTQPKKSPSREEAFIRPKFRRVKKQSGEQAASPFLKRLYKNLPGGIRARKRGPKRFSRGAGRAYPDLSRFHQRVVIKSRVVRNRGRGLRTHLGYIEREGVGPEGEKGCAFNEGGLVGEKERKEFVRTVEKDRHHFRFIVSPEKGEELELESFAKRFVKDLEKDLGTKLEWLAVVHTNTEQPHIHFIIRGRTEEGKDLVIDRAYISSGMRNLASRLATEELGFRLDSELKKERESLATKERFTVLDKRLIQHGQATDSVLFEKREELLIRRLRFLETLGFTKAKGAGAWELHPNLEEKLRALGRRGDIIKRMHELSGIREAPSDLVPGQEIFGKVIAVGLYDELSGKPQMLVECEDGLVRSVVLGEGKGLGIRKGDIVRIAREDSPRKGAFRGVLFGWEESVVNLSKDEREEVKQRVYRAAMQRGAEEEEEKAKRRPFGAAFRGGERVRSSFLRRFAERGRQRE